MRGEGDEAAALLREIDVDEGFTDTDHGMYMYQSFILCSV